MSAFISGERRGDSHRSERHKALDEFFPSETLRVATEPWPSCCGSCDQGRRLCVTPEACQRAERPVKREPSRLDGEATHLLGWLCAASAVSMLVGLVAVFW